MIALTAFLFVSIFFVVGIYIATVRTKSVVVWDAISLARFVFARYQIIEAMSLHFSCLTLVIVKLLTVLIQAKHRWFFK